MEIVLFTSTVTWGSWQLNSYHTPLHYLGAVGGETLHRSAASLGAVGSGSYAAQCLISLGLQAVEFVLHTGNRQLVDDHSIGSSLMGERSTIKPSLS